MLSFLGTSGVGKTRASSLLVDAGYEHIELDELIGASEEMSALLDGVEGEDAAEKMGNLFGVPWEDPARYEEMQNLFLDVERRMMNGLIEQIEAGSINEQTVIDVTGSVIYLPDVMEKLASVGVELVHLQASPEHVDSLIQTFLTDPKPVCWGDLIQEWHGQTVEALPELYPRLLAFRTEKYQQYATVELPWEEHRSISNGEQMLSTLV